MNRYCIFHDTLCQGKQPSWYDDATGMPCTYATKREAELEIIDTLEEHVRQMKEGTRELEGGIGFDDWVEVVQVLDDGTVCCTDGDSFGRRDS